MHLCHLWTHLSNPFWKNSLGHTVVERWRSITRFAFKFGFAFFKLFHPCLHITFNNYHLSINISEANLDVGSSTSFFRQKVHNCTYCFVFNTWNTCIHTKQERVSVLQKESFYLILIWLTLHLIFMIIWFYFRLLFWFPFRMTFQSKWQKAFLTWQTTRMTRI